METLDVLDLPQLYTRPSAETLLDTLGLLTLAPQSWDFDEETNTKDGRSEQESRKTKRRTVQVNPEGVTRYLTSIVSNPLKWIQDEEVKEEIWNQASLRMSERSGRTAMGSLSREFRIPLTSSWFTLTIHEPALTGDDLGLKTWAASYMLSKRLHKFDIVDSDSGSRPPILELGSGTGLVGLAMAALGAAVILTDLPNIQDNLARNAKDNSTLIEQNGGSARTGTLDWMQPASCELFADGVVTETLDAATSKFPIILAADTLYSPELPRMLVDTIAAWLSEDANAQVITEFPYREFNRQEMKEFRERMESIGLYILEEGEENGFDDWGASGAAGREEDRALNPSFVLKQKDEVVYEDRPIPELPSPYDVLVKPKWTGICGSDVHYWVEGRIGHFVVEKPMVLGHESAGIIEKVGDKVKTLKVGDRVAMEPGVPCRRCVRCKEGKYNLCPDMAFAATPPYDGTLARYYTLPEDYCYKLPENMSLEEGALIEPTAVAVHITRQAAIKPGDSVVVFGAGPVGLLCCAVAKAYGAKKIVTVDINDERLNFALKYAANASFKSARVSAEENAKNLIKECELGPGADVIIDASGAEPCIQTAIHALRMGGTYVQGGMGKPDINFPIMAMCTKELNVKGSFRYGSGDYQTAVDLVASERISIKELITGKVSFDEAEKAFADVKQGKGIKILIEGPKE
ncbi:hypothetical protein BU25DRAFT_458437 [Macroventuria anomochaeta]|uniref:Uncharacterized protein n=1 Tax=Macroventuria anomochaeta TaxID=301207 RepID=A0ACB6RZY2_9PLEO|nr:uncharacterized protein BU25DRAFT_458437 [Macroventuria anomochaeta]KAF2627540.1 hypothetical protein BU25DRAFT_458437 [Macroventuria anomochaeta]